MPANLENSAVATGLEKVSLHSNAEECSNYHTSSLISHVLARLCSRSFKLGFSNQELPDVQADFEEAEEPEIKSPTIHWIMEKARKFQKNIY